MKVSRSLKLMRGAAIRTRKLARDMLMFWKRVDKEMVSCCFLCEAYLLVVSTCYMFMHCLLLSGFCCITR